MKLNIGKIETSASANFQTSAFDIGNKAVIMDILRGKMYSNPIKIICQEIMSNARDAHREVNKSEVPIEITFPTSLDPQFTIRDYGPGITPQRMSEIFVMYGESTKRDNNLQTGGFGLGSKTPFSYADTFTVVSITPENGQLVKRQYVAYIDDSRLGAMSLVSESITTEEKQGTAITVTVVDKDYQDFKGGVVQTAKYWPVRPIITNEKDFVWDKVDILLRGTRWFIENTAHNSENLAIVDGIQYKIDLNNIFKKDAEKIPLFQFLAFRLEFNTGEVDVTATREELDYRDKTCNKIRKSLQVLDSELSQKLSEYISEERNLVNAVLAFRKFRNKFQGFTSEEIQWRGIKLLPIAQFGIALSIKKDAESKPEHHSLNVKTFFPHGYYSHIQNKQIKTVRSETVDISKLDITDDIVYFEDDTDGKYAKQRAFTIIEEGKNIDKVVFIKFASPEHRKFFVDNFYWNQLEVRKLSSVQCTEFEIERNRDTNRVVIKVKRLASKHYARRNRHNSSSNEWVEAKPEYYENDEIKYFVVLRGASANLSDDLKNSTPNVDDMLTPDECVFIQRLLKKTLLGVSERFSSTLDNKWIRISRSILGSLFNAFKNSSNIQKYLKFGRINGDIFALKPLLDIDVDKIGISKDSIIRTYLTVTKAARDNGFADEVKLFERIGKILGNLTEVKPEIDLIAEITKNYPLLEHLGYYNSKCQDDIILYIVAKDKQIQSKIVESTTQPNQS